MKWNLEIHGVAQEPGQAETLLRESSEAERTLIDAEFSAEQRLVLAEKRYRRSLDKLERSQQRVERRRREFEQARSQLDQCQLERAAGPLIRRVSVARPTLPRPARDDSRARPRTPKPDEPAPDGAGSNGSDPEQKS
jgi:hypothetical protein